MAATPSNMMELGTSAPNFNLKDTVSGQTLSLSQVQGEKGTLIMFICNHCPFVKHVNAQLVQLALDYKEKGIGLVAISANDVENYPQDAPEKMTETAKEEGYPFPYLFDEDQSVAKAFDAACTPDFFLFDADLKCFYRGQLDDSRPSNDKPVDGHDLRMAIEALLKDQEAPKVQKPSMGCNIKWKQG